MLPFIALVSHLAVALFAHRMVTVNTIKNATTFIDPKFHILLKIFMNE